MNLPVFLFLVTTGIVFWYNLFFFFLGQLFLGNQCMQLLLKNKETSYTNIEINDLIYRHLAKPKNVAFHTHLLVEAGMLDR